MRSTALALRKAASKGKGSAVFSSAHPPQPTSHTLSDIKVNDVPAFERFCISYVLETHKQHAGVYQRGWKSPANMAQSHMSQKTSLTVTPDKIPILDLFLQGAIHWQ